MHHFKACSPKLVGAHERDRLSKAAERRAWLFDLVSVWEAGAGDDGRANSHCGESGMAPGSSMLPLRARYNKAIFPLSSTAWRITLIRTDSSSNELQDVLRYDF
eukprot:1114044-Prorocentrum_minimum.AAC.3